MKVIYVADDGTQFDDRYECEYYEWVLNHPSLKEIVFYDEDGNVLADIFSQDTYEYTMKIFVPTDEAAKELSGLGRYAGFCAYENIDSAGTWVWKVFDRLNGKFVKVEE